MRGHTEHRIRQFALVLTAAAVWMGGWAVMPGVTAIEAQGGTGAVYTMTNDATNNEVMAYQRSATGLLTLIGPFSTEGMGTGDNLFSQGSVKLSPNKKYLFVVNAGSDDITSFTVQPGGGLSFVDRVASGGVRPTSLTVFGNFLYVVNYGGAMPNVTGFTIGSGGTLTEIPNSTRALSNQTAHPGEVDFNNNGTILAVTEGHTNKLDTFTVNSEGVATGPLVQNSNGQEPFGFAFDPADHMIVSEGVPSAVSSYSVSASGVLTLISGSVPDGGSQACWVIITNSSRFATPIAYISNTGSGTLSSYSISPAGALTLLASKAATGVGSARDMGFGAGFGYLYVFEQAKGAITGFQVASNGSLNKITNVTGLPVTAYGLASF